MTVLNLKNEFYPPILLEKWKQGDHSFLRQSTASDIIKSFLIKKAKERPGKRFFGEAYIVSKFTNTEGWYSSYKWLTQSKWLSGNNLKSDFEESFYRALLRHFGVDTLRALQDKSNFLFINHKNRLFYSGRYHKPVAPDLWLIDSSGTHFFIESKLSDDCIRVSQVAGLALVAKHLNKNNRVHVSLVNLYSEGSEPKSENDTLGTFSYFYDIA
jgi:hypothetical protein